MSGTRGDLGLVGLGLMGSALAERWIGAGGRVFGCDISEAARGRFAFRGGVLVSDVAQVFELCERVVFSLPTDREVGELLWGGGVDSLAGRLVMDTTTGDPLIREEWGGRLAGLGGGYVDATFSGSSEQLRSGEGLWMIGGEPSWVKQAEEVAGVVGGRVIRTGAWGSGARMKLVTNLVLGLNRAVLAEGLAFGHSVGLGKADLLEVLRLSAAYSRVMDSKGERMVLGEFDSPQARLSQHLKDVELILGESMRSGQALPLTEIHRGLLRLGEEKGWGGLDNSVIMRVFEAAGLGGGGEV